MRRGHKVAVAVAAGVAVVGIGVATHSSSATATLMPATVPALNPNVTQANIATTICVSGWTARLRPPTSVTGPIKARLERGRNIVAELDHAVPLELGGWSGADGRNLWLEPITAARMEDHYETAFKNDVCAGRKTLQQARDEIVRRKETQG